MPIEYMPVLNVYCKGVSENEPFLSDVFVANGKIEQIMLQSLGMPVLLIGKKGTGKSAIIQMINKGAKSENIPSLILGSDVLSESTISSSNADVGKNMRILYFAILREIGIRLGENAKGILNRSDKKLFDLAKKEGLTDDAMGQAFLKVVTTIGKSATDIDFAQFIPKSQETPNRGIELAIKASLSSNKIFFLLLDDIDFFVDLENPGDVNKFWGLLLAAKKLSSVIPGMKCVISIREEVWNKISASHSGRHDQIDHFNNCKVFLRPGIKDLEKILTKRLFTVRESLDLGGQVSDPYETFFDDRVVRFSNRNETERSWPSFILKQSRERPRDAIQFIGLMAQEALACGKQKIDSNVAESSSENYSNDRVSEIEREFGTACPEIASLIEGLQEYEYRQTAENTKAMFRNLIGRGVTIGKTKLNSMIDEHVFRLWRLFFQAGIINPVFAVEPDKDHDRGFSHLQFEDVPDMINHGNWNEIQRYAYEVHPIFRPYIQKKKKDKTKRISLSTLFRGKTTILAALLSTVHQLISVK